MRSSLYDGLGAGFRIAALEDARANEDGFRAEFADESCVGRSGDSASGEIGNRKLAGLGDGANKIQWRTVFLGFAHQFVFAHGREGAHFANDGAHVTDGFDNIAGAGFTLGANHGRAFSDAAKRFSKIARATDERDAVVVLPDVIFFVSGSEDFALVDEIHLQRLQNFRFGEVADADLGHDRDRDGLHNLADDFDGSHASDAAFLANVGGHALEGHDSAGASVFGDFGLLGVSDVHDDAAL